jgi:glycerophosphoryl diester phosphodiesterase
MKLRVDLSPIYSLSATLLISTATFSPRAFAANAITIGHRGASAYLPEHTLASAAAAHVMGADFIEPDVVLTKDNVPVVLHDIHLELTTDVAEKFPQRARKDGRFYAIDFTLAEIRQLAVAERKSDKKDEAAFPNRFPRGKSAFSVPTLKEFAELVQGLNKSTGRVAGIYPEIKSPAWHREEGKDIAKITLEELKALGYYNTPDQIYFQCFDAEELQRVAKEFKPPFPLIQLIGENDWGESKTDYNKLKTAEGLKEVAKYAQGIGPWIPQLVTLEGGAVKKTTLAADAKAAGLKMHPYTLRKDQLPAGQTFSGLVKLLVNDLGVDGIFTDFPDQLSSELVALNKLRK